MHTGNDPHRPAQVRTVGTALDDATSAMILIHGRGASAKSILDLARYLPHPSMAYVAPQAAGNTWYPYSFLEPLERNQPGLDSALAVVGELVEQVVAAGISAENIIIGGFSQGACLASEFVVRNPRRYGGLLVFSGGVIGPPGTPRNESGSLDGTPVFIGCSDVDFHIPVKRVDETAHILSALSGSVTKRIYPQMGHTIIQDELDEAMKIVGSLV